MGTFEVHSLGGPFGAEVLGFDIARPADDGDIGRIRDAINEHAVLVFRDQDITPAQHVAFSRRFGALEDHVQAHFQYPGHPEIFVVSNVVENGRNIGAKNSALAWHSDYSYMAIPAMASLFYAVTIPKEGGDTWFADMRAAYDDLPAERKAAIEGLRAVHDFQRLQQTQFPDRPLTPEQRAKAPPVAHPVARTHPESGRKSLFLGVGAISHCVTPGGETVSRDIIDELLEHATSEKYVYKHRYRPGDLVLWDNRCTMHRNGAYDDGTWPRVMHRTTVCGDRPF